MADWDPGTPLPDSFFEIAQRVYANDPDWLPEDKQSIAPLFTSGNPFFGIGEAWVSVKGNTRLVGFRDPRISYNEEPVAYFGYWETEDDQEVNRALFADLEEWARAKGAKAVYGPVNFSTYQDYRLRLTFENQGGPFLAEPYNPSRYNGLLEELGYSITMEWESQILTPAQVDFCCDTMRPMVQQMLKGAGIRVEAFTPELWLNNIENFYELINIIWADNFGYFKTDLETFKMVFGSSLAGKMCRNSSVAFFKEETNQLIGYFVTYPDYAPLMRAGNPERVPYRDVSFDTHHALLQSPVLLAKSGAVHPDYRKAGLFGALAVELTGRAREAGYAQVVAALARSDNASTRVRNMFPEGLNEILELRKYGLYSKAI